MRRRLPTTLADQILSSASNFLVVVAVARVSGIAEFGAFSLIFLIYQMALGLMRAGAGDVLLIRSSTAETQRAGDPHHALSFVLAFAVPAAAATGAVGVLLAGGPHGELMIAIAIVLVPALLQDCYRYIFFARSQPQRAVVIDTVWLVAQLGGFALAAIAVLPETPSALILIWGSAAALSCLCGASLARVVPGLTGMSWLRMARHRAAGLMADFMLLTGVGYIGLALIPLVANLPTMAALRGARFLFNPFLASLTGIRVIALPTLTRRIARGKQHYYRAARLLGGTLVTVAVVYSAILLLLPDSIGAQLLGDSWTSVSAILVPVALAYMAQAVAYSAVEGLRVVGSASRLLTTRAIGSTLTIGLMLAGAATSGAMGGAIGMCVGRWSIALLWQVSLRKALASPAGDVQTESAIRGTDTYEEPPLIALDRKASR